VRYWKIHLAWVLCVPFVAALWGRWTVSRRESGQRGAVVAARSRLPPPYPASTSEAAPRRVESPPATTESEEAENVVAQLRRLLRSEQADRSEVSRLLHRIPDGPEKRELLLLELASPVINLRFQALNDLPKLFGADAVPLVQGVLKNDPEASVRRVAAHLLGVLGGAGTMEALLGAVHDPERYVQVTAAGALNRLGQTGPAEELIPRVAADLSSPDDAVRREALKDLSLLQHPATIPILLRCLRDSNADVRVFAAVCLGDLDSPDLLPTLEGLRKDPDSNVAEAAGIAITRYSRKKR